jgi:thymidylate synthase (FAD)
MKVKLIAHTPNPEEVVAQAAKLCYSPVGVDGIMEKLTPEKINKFVDHLATIGHESPLEHVTFTFAIEGISRVTTHQIVRHRLASYSQQSQRYVKLEQFEYIIPPEIAKDSYARTIFIKHMEDSQKAYDELVNVLIENKLDKKYPTWIEDTEEEYMSLSSEEQLQLNQNIRNLWAKNNKKAYSAIEKEAIEDARYVFPNACETKIVMTMNARSLLHFFNVRCCNRAQWEIRAMADEMLKECKKVAPTLFKKAGPDCTFGKCGEGSMSCGHPRKPEDLIGKMHEWCPECDTENEFPLELKPHKCKKCGKELKPCSICYEDNTECNKCKFE